MMYVVFNIDHIHHSLNEPKMLNFAYNSDRRVYIHTHTHTYTNLSR